MTKERGCLIHETGDLIMELDNLNAQQNKMHKSRGNILWF